MRRKRILIGDDHSLILSGIKGLLETDYEVVGTEADGAAVVQTALRIKPDLIVLDVSMPVLNGIEAAHQIKTVLPSTKVVFLSMHSNPIYLRKAIHAGASGYVLKSGAAEELLTAIEQAWVGKIYVSTAFGSDVLDSLRHSAGKASRSVLDLTDRQRQILQLIAEGKQNKEVAEIVHVSVRTVEFHRARLMTKLSARSVAELTKYAIQEGLIDAGQS